MGYLVFNLIFFCLKYVTHEVHSSKTYKTSDLHLYLDAPRYFYNSKFAKSGASPKIPKYLFLERLLAEAHILRILTVLVFFSRKTAYLPITINMLVPNALLVRNACTKIPAAWVYK